LLGKLPWFDAVLNNRVDGQYHLVDSCPDGLSASNDAWSLTIREFPVLAVGLEIRHAIKEGMEGDDLEFFIGKNQLQIITGPSLSGASVEQGGELAPGTVLGVPLTRSGDHGSLVLGFQVPFEVEQNGEIAVQQSCYPKMPRELNGLTTGLLSAKVKECGAHAVAVAAGESLKEERLRRISAPKQLPHFAAYCSLIVHELQPDAGTTQ
jgi:hypothetical protein